MKKSRIHKKFILELIASVQKEEALWRSTHLHYSEKHITNGYWTEIAFKLGLRFDTKNITAELCKSSWQQLIKVHWERDKHYTASTFDYEKHLLFLGCTEIKSYGMFEKKNSINLLPAHAALIFMSIMMFVFMNANGCFVPTEKLHIAPTTFLFFGPYANICQSAPLRWITAPSKSKTKYFTMALKMIAAILITSYFLLFTPVLLVTENNINVFNINYFALYNICLAQITAYRFHGFKLSRPTLPVEHMAHLAGLLINAFSMLVFASFFEWNLYYLYFPIVTLLNALILVCHAVISTRNPEEYPYQNMFHYIARPESEENPFSLVITVENNEKYTRLSN